jgi:peptidoglycan/LPS O-acetylase OafA/YrhL
LLILLLYIGGKISDVKILFLNLSFLFGFFSYEVAFIPVAVSWSLFVEEIFYLIFPWSFKFFTKSKIWFFLILSVVLSILLMRFSVLVNLPQSNFFVEHSPLSHFQYFFLGILISLYHQTKFSIRHYHLMSLILFLILITMSYVPNLILVFLFTILAIKPDTILFRILDFKFLKWIGVRCYCIYLIHSELGMALDSSTSTILNLITNEPDLKLILHFFILTIETCIIAGLSYKFFERPFIKAHP